MRVVADVFRSGDVKFARAASVTGVGLDGDEGRLVRLSAGAGKVPLLA